MARGADALAACTCTRAEEEEEEEDGAGGKNSAGAGANTIRDCIAPMQSSSSSLLIRREARRGSGGGAVRAAMRWLVGVLGFILRSGCQSMIVRAKANAGRGRGRNAERAHLNCRVVTSQETKLCLLRAELMCSVSSNSFGNILVGTFLSGRSCRDVLVALIKMFLSTRYTGPFRRLNSQSMRKFKLVSRLLITQR